MFHNNMMQLYIQYKCALMFFLTSITSPVGTWNCPEIRLYSIIIGILWILLISTQTFTKWSYKLYSDKQPARLLLTHRYLHIFPKPHLCFVHGVPVPSMISQMMKPLLTEPEPVPHATLNTSLPLEGPDVALTLLPFRLAVRKWKRPLESKWAGVLQDAAARLLWQHPSSRSLRTGPSHAPAQALALVLSDCHLLVVETPEAPNCNVTKPLYEAAVAQPVPLAKH